MTARTQLGDRRVGVETLCGEKKRNLRPNFAHLNHTKKAYSQNYSVIKCEYLSILKHNGQYHWYHEMESNAQATPKQRLNLAEEWPHATHNFLVIDKIYCGCISTEVLLLSKKNDHSSTNEPEPCMHKIHHWQHTGVLHFALANFGQTPVQVRLYVRKNRDTVLRALCDKVKRLTVQYLSPDSLKT